MSKEQDESPRPDPKHLQSLERKLIQIRDRVRQVIDGRHYGFYLYGEGGLGKSFNVTRELEEQKASYQHFNSRITAKGLFLALRGHPDAVHLIEDVERMTQDRDAQGVLRSALWCQPDCPRVVTWTNATEGVQRFIFRGGIIMTANRPLGILPELQALGTRINVTELDASDDELSALMRKIASQGFYRDEKTQLPPMAASEICELVLDECRQAGCPLDLRLFDRACIDFISWMEGRTQSDYRDLIANMVRQSADQGRYETVKLSREGKKKRERDIAAEICRETDDREERVRMWKERTDKSQAAFYRRKAELDADGE
jgi:hypothetical protein